MPILPFIAVLAFSAIASATNATGTLSWTGLDWPETFVVFQSTAIVDNINLHPNKWVFMSNGNSLTLAPRIQADTAGGFSELQMEQYSVACIARTDNALVAYLVDCTVDILDEDGPAKPPIDTFRYHKTQKIDLNVLKFGAFVTRKIEKPQQLSTILLQVTFHPDSLAQLIGGTSSLTGYGVALDDFNYGLKRAPGSTAQCPRSFAV
ncbi:hypothetical protein PG997_006068 [Apiospora hydei]|uniref:Uncharacterized protein n=1 Tax=Apiospora hydei TaxID=1337664 RepID=A0ABR1WMQ0_9PEZI